MSRSSRKVTCAETVAGWREAAEDWEQAARDALAFIETLQKENERLKADLQESQRMARMARSSGPSAQVARLAGLR